jgi:predicted GIY-YIG superfamily endonuclease
MWWCYILRCTDENHKNLTYNGSTNNIVKRLRQHCGEISGGAKATHGKQWEVYALVTGFRTHVNCLSCEWRIKKPTNKKVRPAKFCGVAGRIKGLNNVLMLDKWTNQCTIENKDCNYTVYIVDDMLEHLDIDAMPNNITVFSVDKIDREFLENLQKL